MTSCHLLHFVKYDSNKVFLGAAPEKDEEYMDSLRGRIARDKEQRHQSDQGVCKY